MRNIINKAELESKIKEFFSENTPEEAKKWMLSTYMKHALDTLPILACVHKDIEKVISGFVEIAGSHLKSEINLLDDVAFEDFMNDAGIGSSKAFDKLFKAITKHDLLAVEVIDEPWVKPDVLYHKVIPDLDEEVQDFIDLLESDWIKPKLKGLSHYAVNQVEELVQNWHNDLREGASKVDDLDSLKTIYRFPDGNSVVQLVSKKNFVREGALMHSCTSSYYSKKGSSVFSLRDPDNMPILTMEVKGKIIVQVRGKYNKPVPTSKLMYLMPFLEETGFHLILTLAGNRHLDDDDDEEEVEDEDEYEYEDDEDDDEEEDDKPRRNKLVLYSTWDTVDAMTDGNIIPLLNVDLSVNPHLKLQTVKGSVQAETTAIKLREVSDILKLEAGMLRLPAHPEEDRPYLYLAKNEKVQQFKVGPYENPLT